MELSRRGFLPVAAAAVGASLGPRALAAAPRRARSIEPGKLAAMDGVLADLVRAGDLAGIVVLIARHGRIEHHKAIGYANLRTHEPMREDSIFRIYSMTKAITSVALMMLYEEGRFGLEDPVSRYIPAFRNLRVLRAPDAPLTDTVPLQREPLIHDLFRHTAGLGHGLSSQTSPIDAAYVQAGLFDLDVSLEQMMDRLAAIPLHNQPGTVYEYSISPDVQARLVEILSGKPFAQFLQERVLGPLGMRDTGFQVPPAKAARLVPVNWQNGNHLTPCEEPRTCPPAEHFLLGTANLNSYAAHNRHTGGSYGLVSTAGDYWRIMQMLLNGGTLDGRRYLSRRTVSFMTSDHLGLVAMPAAGGRPSGAGFGLGMAIVEDPAIHGEMLSRGTFYWGGIAGTTFWVDPKEDLVVVAMTQHMGLAGAGVPGVGKAFTALRAMTYAALVD